MAPKEVYRNGDYDVDPFIEKTASWPDGLHEEYRFLPDFEMKIRRSSSEADISRYERYYQLAQSNQGKWFTWRHYLQILRKDLRHFDTVVSMSRMLLHRIATPVNSEISNYVTASDSDSTKKKATTPTRSKWRQRSFFRKEVVGGDAESISSMDSNLSLTPNTNLLKKMCTEIRTLAHKTCKTMEKMSVKSKYCSGCGDYMGSSHKLHRKCSQKFQNGTLYCKPLTSGGKNASSIVKTRSKTIITPVRGGGECSVAIPPYNGDPQCSKTTFYMPHLECKSIKSYAKQ